MIAQVRRLCEPDDDESFVSPAPAVLALEALETPLEVTVWVEKTVSPAGRECASVRVGAGGERGTHEGLDWGPPKLTCPRRRLRMQEA